MFMDNYPRIQMEAIVFIMHQIFLITHGPFEYWGMSLGFSPVSCRGIFCNVNESRESENI